MVHKHFAKNPRVASYLINCLISHADTSMRPEANCEHMDKCIKRTLKCIFPPNKDTYVYKWRCRPRGGSRGRFSWGFLVCFFGGPQTS